MAVLAAGPTAPKSCGIVSPVGALRARILLAAALVVASLALAPAASAQSCQAAPGRAAVEQYCESIPGPGGDRGINAGGKSTRLSGKALQTRKALERSGGDGKALTQFLAAAPATVATGDPAGTGSGRRETTTPGESGARRGTGSTGKLPAGRGAIESGGASGGVASAVQASSSSGAGVLLAVGLLGALLALSVFLARRRVSR